MFQKKKPTSSCKHSIYDFHIYGFFFASVQTDRPSAMCLFLCFYVWSSRLMGNLVQIAKSFSVFVCFFSTEFSQQTLCFVYKTLKFARKTVRMTNFQRAFSIFALPENGSPSIITRQMLLLLFFCYSCCQTCLPLNS